MAVTVIKNYGRRMVSGKKSKTALWIGVGLLAVTGIGLYIWNVHRKKKEALAKVNATDPSPKTATQVEDTKPSQAASVTQTISSSTNSITVQSSKPKDTKAFQTWANKTKAAGLVVDGIFGPKSKAAWNQYGVEYQKIENMVMQPFSAYKGNPIGKTVYAKYTGADVFDGGTPDGTFNKIATTTKGAAVGIVAKVLPTSQGSFVVFRGSGGSFFKVHSANLDIFA